jgi:RNA exonuclease 4
LFHFFGSKIPTVFRSNSRELLRILAIHHCIENHAHLQIRYSKKIKTKWCRSKDTQTPNTTTGSINKPINVNEMKSKLYLSANQKKLLKARRRKKKQFDKLQQQTTTTTLSSDNDKDIHPIHQQQNEEQLQQKHDDNDNKNKKTTVINGSLSTNESETSKSGINNKKRQRSSLDPSSTETIIDNTLQNVVDTAGNGSVTIIIPSNLSIKDSKKFRKDERRKYKKDGKDENLLIFLTEEEFKKQEQERQNDEEKVQQKKKKQKIFPSINELVANAKRETIIQQQKLQNDTLSNDYTSKFIAIDCEMVGVGSNGRRSALARVSIVDWHGAVLLDTYVQVPEKVTDYRTWVSGIKAKNISKSNNNSIDIKECRLKVSTIIHKKILVGHAIKNDLDALMMKHPQRDIRDTSKYRLFQKVQPNGTSYRPRKLKDLVKEFCNISIQQDGKAHNSIEDAQGTMELFKMVHSDWEKEIELLNTHTRKK